MPSRCGVGSGTTEQVSPGACQHCWHRRTLCIVKLACRLIHALPCSCISSASNTISRQVITSNSPFTTTQLSVRYTQRVDRFTTHEQQGLVQLPWPCRPAKTPLS